MGLASCSGTASGSTEVTCAHPGLRHPVNGPAFSRPACPALAQSGRAVIHFQKKSCTDFSLILTLALTLALSLSLTLRSGGEPEVVKCLSFVEPLQVQQSQGAAVARFHVTRFHCQRRTAVGDHLPETSNDVKLPSEHEELEK